MAHEARSLKAFGVAGALAEDCSVFYTSDFRSRNIGRFSDLMAARLREIDADELRIRALLLFSLYESYAAIGKTFRSLVDVPPVSLEVGYDTKQIAIGVTFHWREGRPPIVAGLAQRVPNGVFQTPFEEVLGFLRQHSSKLIVKYEDTERRIEIVTLLDRLEDDRRDPMEVIEVDSSKAPYFQASEYVEMGDLDYLALIGESTHSTTTTGEEKQTFTADDLDPPSAEAEVRSAALDDPAEFLTKIGSDEPYPEDEPILVSGSDTQIEELQQRIRELEAENRLALSESMGVQAAADENDPITISGGETVPPPEEGWGLSFLKQIWPFNEEEESTRISAGPTAEEVAPIDPSVVQPTGETLKIIDELTHIASEKKGSAVFQQVVQEIAAEVDESKSKRWVDGLMSEVLQEKARLAELSRDLKQQARQRELEYKTKERTLQNEVARLNEMSKRKENQLERDREQIAQLKLALERTKTTSSGNEDAQTKLRLTTAQRLVQSKEEENRGLAQKVKTLEDRLIVAQARSSRPTVDTQMVARLQAAERKTEELKRMNQRLTESLALQKQTSGEKDGPILRRKIESMERQATDLKKSLEKAQFRVRELQESERKLQLDQQKILEENRKLRGGRASSGDSGSQAA